MSKLKVEKGVSSKKNNEDHYWKSIWSMRILGSVKQFIWKVCNNLLPAKVNLAKKKVVDEDFCPLCGNTETIIHALWNVLPLVMFGVRVTTHLGNVLLMLKTFGVSGFI